VVSQPKRRSTVSAPKRRRARRPRRASAAVGSPAQSLRGLDPSTALQLAEGALQASDELYVSVVEALNDGVVVQDATGRILAANASAERMLSRPRSELIGRSSLVGHPSAQPLVRLVHEDGSPFLEQDQPAMASIRTNEPQVGVVMGIERLGTSTRWLSINSRPLRHPEDYEPYAAVSSLADITAFRDTVKEVQAGRVEDLKRLALAAEYRDDDTHRHTERVARLTERLALKLGLRGELVVTMRRAAPLHDVGKIGIPDRILLKPGRLSGAEYDEMKTHTTIGARILADSQFPILRLGREIALAHHERWDGSGYPSGLSGRAIPLAGRILAVADAFDAITHARPYKEAFPLDYAVAEITLGSGTQFDPEVVEAFAKLRHHELVEDG
jgi:putative nucleotidyltransferase with HDIG domain/PAS domain S-box-containing protein